MQIKGSARADRLKNGSPRHSIGRPDRSNNQKSMKGKLMKRISYLFVALVSAAALISCQKENADNGSQKGDSIVFSAYVDGADPESKTVFGTNGTGELVSFWNKDEIRVLNGTNTDGCAQNYVTTATGTTSATFTIKDENASFSGTQFIAMSPASPATWAFWQSQWGKYAKGLWLKYNQDATAGSYDPEAHISLAYSENSSFYFKNAVALLKFQSGTSNVTSIKVTIGPIVDKEKDSESLSGNFTFDLNTLKVFHEGNSLKDYVNLSGKFDAGKDYYMAVLPGTYSSIKLTVNDVDVKSKDNVTFDRNGVYDLGEVYPVCEYGIVGGFNRWNLNNPYPLQDTDGDGIFEYKNLKLTSEGFKFVLPGQKWTNAFGAWKDEFYFDKDMTAGNWYSVSTDKLGGQSHDILVSDTTSNWDIYIYCAQKANLGKEYKYIVVKAGSPTPSKP